MTMEDWAMANGSGTLRQAIMIGMTWREMALHERLAMEVATSAEAIPASRVTTGPFQAFPDCRVTTELGWYARTMRARWQHHPLLKNATVKVVYFTATCDDTRREGGGFIIENHGLDWIPAGRVLLVPLAFWDPAKKEWGPPENPL